MKHPIRFAFLALGALALAGCASTVDLKDKKDTPPVVESKPAPQPTPSADQRAVTPVTAPEVDPLIRLNNPTDLPSGSWVKAKITQNDGPTLVAKLVGG